MKNFKSFIALAIAVICSFPLASQEFQEFYYAFGERIEIDRTGDFYVLTGQEIDAETRRILTEILQDGITFVDPYAFKISDTTSVDQVRSIIAVRDVLPEYLTPDSVAIAIRNEVLVNFSQDISENEIGAYLEEISAQVQSQRGRRFVLEPPAGTNPILFSNIIFESELVTYAHPNFHTDIQILRHIPNDEYFDSQFYLHNTGQLINDGHMGTNDADIDAPEAWDITRGSNAITVAVVDEGVTDNHPDLPSARQIRLAGSNFAALVIGGDLNDPEPAGNGNHGNSCAGVIAATQDNNEGISGIAPNVNIMPIRMQFGFGGNSMGDFADAIALATNNGADVISNSWGTGSTNPNLSPDLVTEITNATTNGRGGLGAVVTIAAGNTADHNAGGAGVITFPGNVNVNGVVTVGASDRNDQQANYSPTSNTASPNNQIVDITAPSHRAYSCQIAGESFEVWSIDIPGVNGYNQAAGDDCGGGGTLPIAGEQLPNAGTNFLSYTGRFGGTSAATPQISAVAALILSIDPNLTQQEVFDILMCAAEDVGGYTYNTGVSDELGNGRVNAFRAIMLACPASYNIDWLLEQFTEIEYTASDFITAENLIETDTEVEYHANNSVELMPGFETTSGAVFTAHIEVCTNCNNIIAPANVVAPAAVFDDQTPAEAQFNIASSTNEPAQDFTVFPNPGKGIFSIRVKDQSLQEFSLQIFDLSGKQVLFVKNPQEVDLSQNAPGLYFFRFSYTDKVLTKKVLVSRR